MRNRHYKRIVERIRLLPHVDGAAGTTRVEVTEISMGGARLQHYQAMKVGTEIKLKFEWDDVEILIPAVIVRSSVERFGSNSVYLSGVKFESDPTSESRIAIKTLIEQFVKTALDNQVANASAGNDADYASRLMRAAISGGIGHASDDVDPAFYALRDEGYVKYTFEDGRWIRTRTWEAEQPDEGFTIWHFEDDAQAELLCRDYEMATADMRSVIRLCAELSLFVDDTIPPQKFTP